jgi:hypothetical protein
MPSDDEKNSPVKQFSKNLDTSQGAKEIEQPVVPESSSQVEITTGDGKHVVTKGPTGTIDLSTSEFGTWKMSVNYNENVQGNKFEKVNGSTFINRPLVENSFNKVKIEHDEETGKALVEVAKFIEKFGDPASGELFNKFNEELGKPQPDKSRLKSFWTTIQNNLPSLVSISADVARIVSIFSQNQ